MSNFMPRDPPWITKLELCSKGKIDSLKTIRNMDIQSRIKSG